MSETWIPVAEAAEILGRSSETVRRTIHSGAVEAKRVGDRGWWLVAAADVEALVTKSRKGADAAGGAAGTEDLIAKAS
jgi:excisionase family DNA binding protein